MLSPPAQIQVAIVNHGMLVIAGHDFSAKALSALDMLIAYWQTNQNFDWVPLGHKFNADVVTYGARRYQWSK